ncbi:hypothetical protein NCCP2495_17550 [Dietzia sp. NCCP-2495]|uniref:hypothetical protein n=1 Tax=Dietzia sp. NCCP-2495 TaxID=2934675 RepID=UPI00222F0BCF|nr:hypothetical protein [Dietzia sp. NCCP-2495]GLB63876.1 hypothetical protein NCCP2495_17550 [Dietzia sp. NCCP-2495]
MVDSSREVRATSEMKIHDGVDSDQLRSVVTQLASSTEAEGDHLYGHNFYVDDAAGILFAHEHYRDADAFLQHLKEMDQEVVGALMSKVDVLDLRIYGSINDELRGLLEGFGSVRTFDYVGGFTNRGA